MTTVEELFEEFKKLPDWDLYPMPEVFYTHFKVKKPRPGEVGELVTPHNPPPYISMNEGGKLEIRGPLPGGVREIKEFQTLPVEVKRLTDSGDLEPYPEVTQEMIEKAKTKFPDFSGQSLEEFQKFYTSNHNLISTNQTFAYTMPDFLQNLLNLPTEHNTTETPHA